MIASLCKPCPSSDVMHWTLTCEWNSDDKHSFSETGNACSLGRFLWQPTMSSNSAINHRWQWFRYKKGERRWVRHIYICQCPVSLLLIKINWFFPALVRETGLEQYSILNENLDFSLKSDVFHLVYFLYFQLIFTILSSSVEVNSCGAENCDRLFFCENCDRLCFCDTGWLNPNPNRSQWINKNYWNNLK